jgi:hypothetical protein
MGIAERTLGGGDPPFAAAEAALAARCGPGGPESLLRRLAAEIRAGAVDAPGAAQSAVLRLLWTITVAKLRESNPQFLSDAGIE